MQPLKSIIILSNNDIILFILIQIYEKQQHTRASTLTINLFYLMHFIMLPCDEFPTLSLRDLFSGGLRAFPLPEKPLPTPNFLLFVSRFISSSTVKHVLSPYMVMDRVMECAHVEIVIAAEECILCCAGVSVER